MFGHVLGTWGQGLAWGVDLVCHRGLDPPGHYYGMQNINCLGNVDNCYLWVTFENSGFMKVVRMVGE